jgi:hypothetical protein
MGAATVLAADLRESDHHSMCYKCTSKADNEVFWEDIPTLSAWIPRSARATCPERSRVVAPQSWRKLSMRIPKAMVDRRRGKRGEGSKKWEGEVTTGDGRNQVRRITRIIVPEQNDLALIDRDKQ